MLQKQVESMAVVLMAQVTEFVQKHIVLQHFRQSDDIQIEIDITL